MGWGHYQTVDPSKESPRLVEDCVHLVILHFKFQFSKSIKSSTFYIFLNLIYLSRKKISFSKCPKIYENPQNIGKCSEWRDLALLKTWTRYWHKGHVERRQKSLQVKSRNNSFRKGRTIRNVMRGECGEKKYSCQGGWLKKMRKDEVKKKFQQSDELHCRAYKLYPPNSSSLRPGSKAFTGENNLLIIFQKV